MSLMNRFRNPLAGAWQRAGPDLKYVGFRGFFGCVDHGPTGATRHLRGAGMATTRATV